MYNNIFIFQNARTINRIGNVQIVLRLLNETNHLHTTMLDMGIDIVSSAVTYTEEVYKRVLKLVKSIVRIENDNDVPRSVQKKLLKIVNRLPVGSTDLLAGYSRKIEHLFNVEMKQMLDSISFESPAGTVSKSYTDMFEESVALTVESAEKALEWRAANLIDIV